MEVPAYICSHIFENARPILIVSRAGGDWQCLCGDDGPEERPQVVGLNHLLERDPTLLELRDLPIDWCAERAAPGSPWHRTYEPEDPDAE